MDNLTLKLKKTVGTEEVESTYIASPKGRMVRRAYEIIENLNTTRVTKEDIDTLASFVVELFGNQFTVDDVYDGLGAKALLPTLSYFISYMSGKIEAKLEDILPKDNSPKNA